MKMHVTYCATLAIVVLSGCSGPDDNVASNAMPAAASSSAAQAVNTACNNEGDVEFLCGPENAEDIIRIADSQWLLVSGMNGALFGSDIAGKLYLVNHQDRSYEVIFPGSNPMLEHNRDRFADCPGPVDVNNMSFHGLALRAVAAGSNQYQLYVTSHGGREAIEVFDLDASGKPSVKWVGCVPMPADSFTNSVTILSDGGFYATKFMDPTVGIGAVISGEITGHVFRWRPGEAVEVLPGTELSGANGIEISADERTLYVAAFGESSVVRFDTTTTPMRKEVVAVDVVPDNLRWTPEGTLFTAGANLEGEGWGVVEVNPDTWTARRVTGVTGHVTGLEDASVALPVGDEIWVGSYNGDRVAILQNP